MNLYHAASHLEVLKLALFAALDFERFDEERFWRDMQYVEKRHPEFKTSRYREVFDEMLTEFQGHALRSPEKPGI
jgi:hypothetical protein